MSTNDIPDVSRIERASFTTVWPTDAFYNELSTNKLAHYFVGKLEGRIVAYGGIWVILEDSHITTVAVDPNLRGRGLGEAMVLKLIDEGIERGAAWMTLEVVRVAYATVEQDIVSLSTSSVIHAAPRSMPSSISFSTMASPRPRPRKFGSTATVVICESSRMTQMPP